MLTICLMSSTSLPEGLRRASHTISSMRVRRSDGVYRWFQVRGFPLRDMGGQVVHWYVPALRHRRPEAGRGGAQGAEGSALQREPGAAGRSGPDLDVRGDRRDLAGAAAGARPRGQGRPHRLHRADHRRDRHRQGTRRPRDPSAVGACLPRVRERQLRGHSARADRVGAVRPRERGVHRRDAAAPRPLRAGARRHHLPRRSRRAADGDPGRAAPRAAGARVRARRRERIGSRRRARRSPPRTATCRRRSRPARSAAISSIG